MLFFILADTVINVFFFPVDLSSAPDVARSASVKDPALVAEIRVIAPYFHPQCALTGPFLFMIYTVLAAMQAKIPLIILYLVNGPGCRFSVSCCSTEYIA